jgi:Spy/CpxP family protein refolding chaperone
MKRFLTGVALTLVFSASAFAQQAPPASPAPPDNPERAAGHRRRPSGRAHGPRLNRRLHALRGLRRLDLTDAQRGQFRSIRDGHRQRTEARRAELRQLLQTRRQGGTLSAEQEARARQLQAELRQTGEAVHGEMLAVLTPEQRTRLAAQREEHKARREEFRQRRRPLRDRDERQ